MNTSHWSFSASPLLLAFIVLLWAVSAWVCWANWHRRRGKVSAALEGLRFVIVTLIAFTLVRPEFVRHIIRTEQPEIVILNDVSGSMETRDVVKEPTVVVSRADWLVEVRRTNFWQALESEGKVVMEDFGRPSTNASPNDPEAGTDLAAALDAVLQRQQHLKAVLLLSDGDWNVGKSPLASAVRYRSQKVPIYSVGVGAEKALPDLVLEQVSAPSYGLLGEQISIPFRVQSLLPHEVKTVVTLTAINGVDVRKSITIPAYAAVQDSIVWSPRQLGSYSLNLRLPVQEDEYLSDNNDRSFRIAVRTEKLKVLVIESQPRWEYRFLRNALSRDPGVDLDCLLFHPGMARGEGKNYIQAFPPTKEAMSKYDVVFLGDVGVGENEMTPQDVELLKGLVEQQGSGLVFLPGARGRQLTFLNGALADLIPVIYDANKKAGAPAALESSLLLTTSGRGHFLTMLATDPGRNESVWKSLPGFYWSAAVEKSKPGADVLAVHSGLRNAAGRLPMLVTRSFGSGEVLFMGTDSAWRWRKGVEDTYHYRFWGQVVRWMSHKRHMAQGEGIRLSFNPENPQAGESLFFQTALQDPTGSITSEEKVTAKILSPSGRVETIEFSPVTGGWGVYKASFTPQEGGKYQVTVAAAKSRRNLETEIIVTRPAREKRGQPANLGVLREVSQLTRGTFGTVAEMGRLVREISLLPEAESLEKRVQLWSNPWWGGFILCLLAIYWTARKVAGMI